MIQRDIREVFPIINSRVQETIGKIEERGASISCGKGCDHCCHLLVEVSLKEAHELAGWIAAQDPSRKEEFKKRIVEAARGRKKFFGQKKKTKKFRKPVYSGAEFPEEIYNEYFYTKRRPCPFLYDGACAAYEVRPVPCRLHLVTTPAEHCSREHGETEDYEIPEEIEALRDEIGDIIDPVYEGGSWGELSIMVEQELIKLQEL